MSAYPRLQRHEKKVEGSLIEAGSESSDSAHASFKRALCPAFWSTPTRGPERAHKKASTDDENVPDPLSFYADLRLLFLEQFNLIPAFQLDRQYIK